MNSLEGVNWASRQCWLGLCLQGGVRMHSAVLGHPSHVRSVPYSPVPASNGRVSLAGSALCLVLWERGRLSAEAPVPLTRGMGLAPPSRPHLAEGKAAPWPAETQGMSVCREQWEQRWALAPALRRGGGKVLDVCVPLSFCLHMLSQLSLSEEELIAPKPRTLDSRDQEGKREMLEFMTTTTLEQT